MLVSFNWLKQYVDLPHSLAPEELALKLTMSAVEVEGVKRLGADLDKIIVGKVIKIEKHPDADKLKICKVDVGGVGANNSPIKVVCGGTNVREGMLIAFARVGAKLKWHGQGELVELKPAKIRGVDSFGMICSASEIGLEEMFPQKDEKEIMDLTDHPLPPPSKEGDKIIGRSLAEVLGLDDAVFEIDNKSMTNRPDLWGHYGLAREVAALFKKRLKDYKIKRLKEGREIKLNIKVEDKKLCPRYMAVAIDGIKIGPSPAWMQKYLRAVGFRPINNIVDITNYILLDLGQPMHAFDKSKVFAQGGSRSAGKTQKSKVEIIVRRAKEGEKFKTLDGQEQKLTNEILVIADEQKAIALAGVMGGENSEISDKTTTIIYESATFDAVNIRRTALKLGLRTESSARFEKSLDPNNAESALLRAVELTLRICPGARIASRAADEKNFHLNQGPIELSLEFLRKKIGQEIPKKEAVSILERLGFGVKDPAKLRYGAGKKDKLLVLVPSWRATKDVSIPEDLAEEVARVYGYGKIEPRLPAFPITPPEKNELRALERKIKNILSLEFGFSEAYNYSFISPERLKELGLETDKFLELANPLAKDRPYLRRNIWSGLLENVEKNLRQFDKVKLFEIGKVFKKEEAGERAKENGDELLPRQDIMVGLVYGAKNCPIPFFEVDDAIFNLLSRRLRVDFTITGAQPKLPMLHPGRYAEIKTIKQNEVLGFVAELRSTAQNNNIAVAELNLSKLLGFVRDAAEYRQIPFYPSVKRDIAFAADKKIKHAEAIKLIKTVDPLIAEVELFDVYEGKNLEDGKKSLAYHIVYQSPDRTLTAEEVEAVHQRLVAELKKKWGAEVRR